MKEIREKIVEKLLENLHDKITDKIQGNEKNFCDELDMINTELTPSVKHQYAY